MGDDHAHPVHGAPLENGDEDLGSGGQVLRVGRADEKARDGTQTEQGHRPAFHERASGAGAVHGPYLLWNSGEPRTRAASLSTSVFAAGRSTAAFRSSGVARMISGLSS